VGDALRQTVFDLWRIISQGGWIMGAIFLAGQLGWFLILERWWHYRKMGKGMFASVSRAIGEARADGEEAMVMKARESLHQHVPGLSRHLGTLAVLAGVAPLLGLAGTVIGIMETFRVITLYGAGNPSMMAGGIAQALMVTEAGLVVAFPMLICHDHLQKRADAIEDECVAGATRLIRTFTGTAGTAGAGMAGTGSAA
jgi:biopolymer transport protein ExbB